MNGEELLEARRVLGLTQKELGRLLSVAENTIWRYEKGILRIEHPGMLELALKCLMIEKREADRE